MQRPKQHSWDAPNAQKQGQRLLRDRPDRAINLTTHDPPALCAAVDALLAEELAKFGSTSGSGSVDLCGRVAGTPLALDHSGDRNCLGVPR